MKLASYSRYKYSGVEWLGNMSEHWEVLSLKHWVKINDAILPEDTDPNFKFGTFHVCPPPLTEQTAIVEYLHKATANIARARHEIELLKEYRTRLIADVVTGKLDVREAATLSNESDDTESSYDSNSIDRSKNSMGTSDTPIGETEA